MLEKLRTFPRIFYLLCVYLLIAQAIYSQISPWNFFEQFYEGWYPDNEFISYLPFLSGIAPILAGWLADQLGDVKRGLLVSLGAMLAGGVVGLFHFDATFLLSHFLIETALNLFFFLIVLHVAVLFPTANDWKDNAFVLLHVGVLLAGVLAVLLVLLGNLVGLDDFFVKALIPFGLAVLLIFLIYFEQDLGFDISGGEEDLAEGSGPNWSILIGIVALATVLGLARSTFPSIGTTEDYFSYLLYSNGWLLPVFQVVLMAAVVIFLIHRTRSYSDQFPKMVACFWVLCGVVAVELGVRYTGSYELDQLGHFIPSVLESFLIFPILLSVITHVNLDRQIGLWLGLLYGVPTLVETAAELLVPATHFGGLLLPGISLVLLIAAFIFLRENKTAILDLLALDEPNQESGDEDEPDEDILDHLIA